MVNLTDQINKIASTSEQSKAGGTIDDGDDVTQQKEEGPSSSAIGKRLTLSKALKRKEAEPQTIGKSDTIWKNLTPKQIKEVNFEILK